MKLYFAPGSCALATHIALAESGLPYEIEAVDLHQNPHTTASGVAFTTINPKGYVPALVLDNGETLTEAQVILQYIADHATGEQIAPEAGTLKRYRMMEWLAFLASEIHKSYAPLWTPSASTEEKNVAWATLSKRFGYIDHELNGKEYLLGSFSVADCYLYVMLLWTKQLKLSIDTWPNLQALVKRMAARSAVQQAMKEERL